MKCSIAFIVPVVYDISRSVIINLLSDINQIGAKAKMITESIGIICEQIKLIHTEFKFTLCQLLIDILNICGEVKKEKRLKEMGY